MNNIIDFNIYSNHDKVLRITAWIRHFICNLRVKTQKTIKGSILKPNELKEAEKLLVEANQFWISFNWLKWHSKFRDLNVKLDEKGIYPMKDV